MGFLGRVYTRVVAAREWHSRERNARSLSLTLPPLRLAAKAAIKKSRDRLPLARSPQVRADDNVNPTADVAGAGVWTPLPRVHHRRWPVFADRLAERVSPRRGKRFRFARAALPRSLCILIRQAGERQIYTRPRAPVLAYSHRLTDRRCLLAARKTGVPRSST